MKDYRTAPSIDPFPSAVSSGQGRERSEGGPDDDRHLPDGWRELPTGLRDARLFHVAPPHGGDGHWLAELTLNGQMQRRRFASELHARWWIAVVDEPGGAPDPSGWLELNEPFRAAGFLRGK